MGKYPNSGILRKNADRKSDKHAHYRGSCEVDGHEYWLDAWINTPTNGDAPYMKLSFKPREARPSVPNTDSGTVGQRASLSADLDDAIPFAPEKR
jgi:hypothetical protein